MGAELKIIFVHFMYEISLYWNIEVHICIFQVKQKYAKFPRAIVEFFIKRCPDCNLKDTNVHVALIQPIKTHDFWERVQVLLKCFCAIISFFWYFTWNYVTIISQK